jgi:hypothetical protein
MIDERQSMLGLDIKELELRMQERGSTAWMKLTLEFYQYKEMLQKI